MGSNAAQATVPNAARLGRKPGRLHCRERAFVRELARWGRAGLFWAVCCGMTRDSFRAAAFANRVGTSWIGPGGWGGADPEAGSGLRVVGLMWWQSRECCVKIRPPASGRVTPGCCRPGRFAFLGGAAVTDGRSADGVLRSVPDGR